MTKRPPTFTMNITNAQRDIIDFLVEVVHGGYFNKSSLILELIKRHAKDYLLLPHDIVLTDEELLDLMVEKNNSNIKAILGEEKFNKIMAQRKEVESNE